MLCSKCNHELTDEMFSSGICFFCGSPVEETLTLFREENVKKEAQRAKELREEIALTEKIKAKENQQKQIEIETRSLNHMITTGFNFEGYTITNYLGLVSGETVIGTGYLSNISASISDFFGAEVPEYSTKIKAAKANIIKSMIDESAHRGGNAIIGISYSFMTFSRDIIGISVNGTSVIIEPSL